MYNRHIKLKEDCDIFNVYTTSEYYNENFNFDNFCYRNFQSKQFDQYLTFRRTGEIQNSILKELERYRWTLFVTIQMNYHFSLNTSTLNSPVRFAKDILFSICNDFSGRSHWFLRPAMSFGGNWHFHALLSVRRHPMVVKESKFELYPYPIDTDDALSIYGTTKHITEWGTLRRKHHFPAAKVHLALLADNQAAAKRYVVFNGHTPSGIKDLDTSRYMLGNENFCYAGNIFEKKKKAA